MTSAVGYGRSDYSVLAKHMKSGSAALRLCRICDCAGGPKTCLRVWIWIPIFRGRYIWSLAPDV